MRSTLPARDFVREAAQLENGGGREAAIGDVGVWLWARPKARIQPTQRRPRRPAKPRPKNPERSPLRPAPNGAVGGEGEAVVAVPPPY